MSAEFDDFSDVRDSDQINFQVHTNVSSYHEFLQEYSSFMNDHREKFDRLSEEMYEYYYSNQQPEEEFNRKMKFCKLMKNSIQRHCPNWVFDIVPTGSTVTGLAVKNSDLDVAIHIPQAAHFFMDMDKGEVDLRKASLNILQIVRRIFENDETICNYICHEKPKHIQLVPAQIQILKIYTIDGIECDLSVVVHDFLSSMHNSFLLRHLVHIDDRFAPLCAIVKEWADRTQVKKPKEGGFNSYALVLLVIHFLQCGTSPPVLPHLPCVYENQNFFALSDHRFPMKLDFGQPLPEPIPLISKNYNNVALLFFGFLHYYYKFDFNKKFISMCKAEVINRREGANRKARVHEKKEVYIEDPFDEHNPGRTVRSLKSIKVTFLKTINLFKQSEKFPRLEDIFNMQIEVSSDVSDVEDELKDTTTRESDSSELPGIDGFQ